MTVNPKYAPEALGGKSVAELEKLGAELTKAKDDFLQDWEKAARLVQAEIVEAQTREYAVRTHDPEYAAKRQGPVPDFVKAKKTQIDAMHAKMDADIAEAKEKPVDGKVAQESDTEDLE